MMQSTWIPINAAHSQTGHVTDRAESIETKTCSKNRLASRHRNSILEAAKRLPVNRRVRRYEEGVLITSSRVDEAARPSSTTSSKKISKSLQSRKHLNSREDGVSDNRVRHYINQYLTPTKNAIPDMQSCAKESVDANTRNIDSLNISGNLAHQRNEFADDDTSFRSREHSKESLQDHEKPPVVVSRSGYRNYDAFFDLICSDGKTVIPSQPKMISWKDNLSKSSSMFSNEASVQDHSFEKSQAQIVSDPYDSILAVNTSVLSEPESLQSPGLFSAPASEYSSNTPSPQLPQQQSQVGTVLQTNRTSLSKDSTFQETRVCFSLSEALRVLVPSRITSAKEPCAFVELYTIVTNLDIESASCNLIDALQPDQFSYLKASGHALASLENVSPRYEFCFNHDPVRSSSITKEIGILCRLIVSATDHSRPLTDTGTDIVPYSQFLSTACQIKIEAALESSREELEYFLERQRDTDRPEA